MTKEEEWRYIPDVAGYSASSQGRIFNIKKNWICNPVVMNKGYLIVTINKKSHLVHRLVASAFLGASELHVDHLDHNRANNRVENLRYVTASQNNCRLSNKIRKNNTTGAIGVSKDGKNWRAQVTDKNGLRRRKSFSAFSDAVQFTLSHKTHFLP